MNNALIATFVSLTISGSALADESVKAEDLLGRWNVDLYYSPSAPPSKTEMIITQAVEGKLEGTFYGTSFDASGYTVFENEVLFTVATGDNSGPYYTSGRLKGDCIDGQTLSVGRGFLMAWKACRAQETETP
ncbi:MAG: hypothetical protein AAFX02_02795 [Pseudomonadota bacterium]